MGLKLVAEYKSEGMIVTRSGDLPAIALAAHGQFAGPLIEPVRGTRLALNCLFLAYRPNDTHCEGKTDLFC